MYYNLIMPFVVCISIFTLIYSTSHFVSCEIIDKPEKNATRETIVNSESEKIRYIRNVISSYSVENIDDQVIIDNKYLNVKAKSKLLRIMSWTKPIERYNKTFIEVLSIIWNISNYKEGLCDTINDLSKDWSIDTVERKVCEILDDYVMDRLVHDA